MHNYYYYVGPWIWVTDQMGSSWRMPQNAVSGIDLRANVDITSDGTVNRYANSLFWFVGPQNLGSDYKFFGSGDIREIQPSGNDAVAWKALFGRGPVGTTLMDWLEYQLTEGGSPDGSEPTRILTPTTEGKKEIWLRGHSLVSSHDFVWNTANRYINIYRDLQRHELKRIDKEAKEVAQKLKNEAKELRKQDKIVEADKFDLFAANEKTLAQRYLGWLTKQHFGSYNNSKFTEFHSAGFEPTPLEPTTTISDDFSGSLSNWTTVTGTWSIVSGELKQTQAAHSHLKHNTSLSGAAHLMKMRYVSGSGAYSSGGAATRVSSTGYVAYSFQNIVLTDAVLALRKYTDETTFTQLTSFGGGSAGTSELRSNGSTHSMYFDASFLGNYTDTSNPSNLKVGTFGYSTSYQDNAYGEDISSGAGMIFGRGGLAFNGGRTRGRTLR